MCGRMTLTKAELLEVAEMLDAELPPEAATLYRPRYNIAPTDAHFIARAVASRRELTPAHWGFVRDGRPLVINARAETAPARFRDAYRSRRCVVPADGFYEWIGPREARRPIWFHLPDGKLLAFAGLFDEDHRSGQLTFTVLTQGADPVVAPVHDRMPVILKTAQIGDWLGGAALDLAHTGAHLLGTEVSARVNKVANDDPECLVPEVGGKKGQLGLFDR